MVLVNEELSQEAVYLLQSLGLSDDTEVVHKAADKVLCDLLTELGYTNVVAEYNKLKKWY